jgi:hypothetical protein
VSRFTNFSLAPNPLKRANLTRRRLRAATVAGGRVHGSSVVTTFLGAAAGRTRASGAGSFATGPLALDTGEPLRLGKATQTLMATVKRMMPATAIRRLLIVIAQFKSKNQ